MNSSRDLIPYRKGNLWGYCDRDGNIVLEPKFRSVSHFKFGIAYFVDNENQSENRFYVGLINSSMEIILDPSRHRLAIKKTDLLDKNLNQCESLRFFENTFEADCIYYQKIYDSHLERKSIFDFDVKLSSELFIGFNRNSNNSISLIRLHDRENNIVNPIHLPEKIDHRVARLLLHIKVQLSIHSISNKCGHVLENGIVSIPYVYDNLKYCENGVFIATKEGKSILISEKGKIITNKEYERIEFQSFSNSWVGFVDEQVFRISIGENLEELVFGSDLDPSLKIFLNPKKDQNEKIAAVDKRQSAARFVGPRKKTESIVIKEERKYESILSLGDNLSIVGVTSLWGMKYAFISSDGQIKFHLNFKDGDFFEENKEIVLYETILHPRVSDRLIDIYYESLSREKVFVGCIDYSCKKFWEGRYYHKFRIDTAPTHELIEEEKDEVGVDYMNVPDYSENHWNEVFGPGDEADEAYRNTRDE